MKISKILERPERRTVATMQASEPTKAAVEYLGDADIRSLLVVDGEALVGIVTVRDLLRFLAKRGSAALEAPLSEVMTRDLLSVNVDDDLSAARALFDQRRINHLPVVQGRKAVGVLTVADVLSEHLDDVRAFSEDLQRYIHGQHALIR
jgi:CBS domain-containing protein